MNLTEKEDRSALAPDDPRVVGAVEEYVSALEAGAGLDREEFLARHADIRATLAGCLDGLQFIRAARPQLDDAPALEDTVAAPLGDFRILREIGRGGMGVVYEAEQMSLGRRVALKVLPFAATLDPKQIQRFKNEAHAAGQLHHTNIVAVHFVGCERGVHFYAMQYIDGQSLAGMLEELRQAQRNPHAPGAEFPDSSPQTPSAEFGTQSVPTTAETPPNARLSTQISTQSPQHFRTVARLGIQAALALEHAHDCGVIHRDVKPGNLLMDFRGNLWVTDFGLAQIQGDNKLTLTGDLVGTLRYMSPEQALAKRVLVDHRSDIYSLGATLYELLTLEPVFTGSDRQELLRQIAFEEPKGARQHNKGIPVELETIVQKAMEKNPTDRYATAQELAHDLERFLKDEPIRARRPSLIQRTRKWARRHRALVRAATAVIVTVLLAGGAVLWRELWHQTAVEHAVAPALERAELLQEQERYEEAIGILTVAAGQLEVRGPAALWERVKRRQRDVDMLMRLQKARLQEVSGDRAMGFDHAGADRKFVEAFAGYDLDVTTLDPQKAADRVRASAICTHLIAGLDNWAFTRDNLVAKGGRQLRAVAELADDDPWRRRLRGAVGRRDRAVLAGLAEENGTQNQPPSNVLLLARALVETSSWAAAEGLLRQAQQRYPGNYWVNLELGCTFCAKEARDLVEGIRFLQAAVACQPQLPVAYINLAIALAEQGKPAEAIAACRKAIELMPDSVQTYCELGRALGMQGKQTEAFAAYQKAIELGPDFAPAHWNLGVNLRDQGRFAESLKELELALKLGFRRRGWAASRAEVVRRVKLFVELDAKLPKILQGDVQPRDAAERVALAELCCNLPEPRRRYAAAARFYTEAFAADPKLAETLRRPHRSNAASNAMMAALGHGLDASELDETQRARLRGQGLDWLRADLANWRRAFEKDAPKVGPVLAGHLRGDYLVGDDFAVLRDDSAVDRLPAQEREAWLKLRADVEELLFRAERKVPGPKK